ncbi:MAG: hypothetical protein QOF21_2588 [Actinomycetota bacterium]|jgi:hypothetical protein
MNVFNPRTNGVLIAALLMLGLGVFLALATDFGNNWDNHHDSDDLAAIAATTSSTFETLPTSTTTTFAVATTLPVSTTIRVTPTTRKVTATTAKKPTTPRPTATTIPAPHSGAGEEKSDNTGTFDHAGTTYTGSAVGACAAADPFCFNLGAQSSTAAHQDQVNILAVFRNHTSKTVSFPGGLRLTVDVTNPDNTHTRFEMEHGSTSSIAPGESITLSTWTSFVGDGRFTFVATCQVDYGS